MNAAWEQIGDVLEANRRIRAAQMAKEVSLIWYERHLKPLRAANLEKSLTFVAPMQKRVVSGDATVFYQINTSLVTPAAVSASMRRILRPRARLMQSLPFEGQIQPNTLIARINDAEVSAANTNTVYYMGPNAAAREFIDPAILEDPSLNPDQAILDELQELIDVGEDLEKYASRYQELRAGG